MSPTERSLKHLRESGYFCWKTEYWDGFAHKRRDLWTFCDILALKKGEVLAVQTTSTDTWSRVQKITDAEATPHVRDSNIRIVVHGWIKGTNGRYRLREIDLS